MDKIWDRNPSKSEVIGRCGGDEKTEWPRGTDKTRENLRHYDNCCTSMVFYIRILTWNYGINYTDQMHYKFGVTCVLNEQVFYTML